MSPLFLVGCAFLVAAVLLGATAAPAAVWVLLGAVGGLLFWRGATTVPRRQIRSHSSAPRRSKGGPTPSARSRHPPKPRGRRGSKDGRRHR